MIRFRPGWVPTLAMLVAVAILCSLGTWQVRRMHWKRGLLAEWSARLDAPPVALADWLARADESAYRRVQFTGRWDEERSILVTHVPREMREGAQLLTPLRLTEALGGGEAVVVDRGWISYARLPELFAREPVTGEVALEGLALPLELAEAVPGSTPEPRREWVRFDPRRHGAPLQAQLPYRLAPVVVQLGEEASDGLLFAGFQRPRSQVSHRHYAITWYSMAGVAVAVWGALGWTRGREPTGPAWSPGPDPRDAS